MSNFHSSLSTATKNCLMPSRVNSSLEDRDKACHPLFQDWRATQPEHPWTGPGLSLAATPSIPEVTAPPALGPR